MGASQEKPELDEDDLKMGHMGASQGG
jgi:hypothetical protein